MDENILKGREEFISKYSSYDLKANSSLSNLIINCEHIYLYQTSIDLLFYFPSEKIESVDYLIINGIRFKKENGE